MRKQNLYASASVIALSLSATAPALAEPSISQQGVINTGNVDVESGTKVQEVGNLALQSSVSIGASGASASVSNTAIGDEFVSIGDDADNNDTVDPVIGNITQGGTDTADGVRNEGTITTTGAAIEFADGSAMGTAASGGISALGAASSISFAALNDNENGTGYTAPEVNGQISQQAKNQGNVTNTGNDISAETAGTGTAPDLTGDAASLSMNATGAATSVGLRSVDTDGFTAGTIGQNDTSDPDTVNHTAGITQNASTSDSGPITLDSGNIEGGTLSGAGASVSAGASGAVASVNATSIASDDFTATVSAVDQSAVNNAAIKADDMSLATGPVTGNAASVGLSATGASAGVSETFISQDNNTQSSIGDVTASTNGDFTGDGITQSATATSTANVDVVDSSVTTGEVSGAGASVRASATGASVSVGSTMLDSAELTGADFGTIDQSATSTADVTVGDSADAANNVTVGTASDASVSGDAASVGISALGAAASVSATSIGGFTGGDGNTGAEFDSITQTVLFETGDVLNTDSEVSVGEVSGSAASASIGATGASGSVSATSVGGKNKTGADFGNITQSVTSVSSVLNTDSEVSVGEVSGSAASASIGATGASGSVSATQVGTFNDNDATIATFSDVTSEVTNTGDVETRNASLTTDDQNVSGIAASVGISALGASAGASSTIISTNDFKNHATVGAVDQDVSNTGNVLVSDPSVTLGTGDLSGNAASASIGATGASASAGASTIDADAKGATFASIDQTVDGDPSAARNVRVNGTDGTNELTVDAVSGTAASASVSATGAAAGVSSTLINGTGSGDPGDETTVTGTVDQTVTLDSDFSVTVDNVGVQAGAVSGTAASVGVSALGASASVSSTLIASDGRTASFEDVITQSVTNNANVENRTTELAAVELSGIAASARIGATGASANAGSTIVDTTFGVNQAQSTSFDDVDQTVSNTAAVTSYGTEDETDMTVGALTGTAASAGVSATGASAGVSSTVINTTSFAADFGDVTQDVSNSDTVTLGDTSGSTDRDVTIEMGAVSGTAASVNASALGASASVGQSAIAASGDGASFGTVGQTVSNTSEVSNRNTSIEGSSLDGVASSASIGATGASASVSASLIETGGNASAGAFGSITQGTSDNDRDVSNEANVLVSGASIDAGETSGDTDPIVLDGTAASVGISATGATAGVSLAALGEAGGTLGESTFADIGQFVDNTSDASISVNDSTLTVDLSADTGIADSASISARGAGASVGVSQIDTAGQSLGGATDAILAMGSITQDVINGGSVTIGGDVSIVSANGIDGIGTSASIAAVGAGASFGLTSIESMTGDAGMTNVQVASINQTVNNSANVTNAGTITVGGAMGAATSAGVSATGATASVSTTSINGGGTP